MNGDAALIPLRMQVRLRLHRIARSTCPSCHRRRVLYTIEVTAGAEFTGWPEDGQTMAQCASCMGIREPR